MAIFASFGGNLTQPISKTYNTAAQQINTYCGPGFVNGTATPLKGAASATTTALTPMFTLFIMLLVFLFQ
jgi:TctA family transporter